MAAANDMRSIARTHYIYASAIDGRDWDGCRSVLSPDLRVNFSGYRTDYRSRVSADEWVAGIRTRMEPQVSQHLMANPIRHD